MRLQGLETSKYFPLGIFQDISPVFCLFCEKDTLLTNSLHANPSHLLILKITLWTDSLVSDIYFVQAFLLPLFWVPCCPGDWLKVCLCSPFGGLLLQKEDVMWAKMAFYMSRLFALMSWSEGQGLDFVLLFGKNENSVSFQWGTDLFTEEKGQQKYLLHL